MSVIYFCLYFLMIVKTTVVTYMHAYESLHAIVRRHAIIACTLRNQYCYYNNNIIIVWSSYNIMIETCMRVVSRCMVN